MLELRGAADMQHALLPPPVHNGRFVEAAAMTTSRWNAGGDFYDYVDTGREFRIALGDAAGRGLPAALHAAMVLGVLAVETEKDARPARVMEQLNQALCRRSIPARFVTLFYAVFTADHRIVYSNAGHCRPLLVNHRCVARLGAGGPPLGLWRDARFAEATLTVETGDVMAAYSDGIVDTVGKAGDVDEEFGDGGVLETISSHREVAAGEMVEKIVAGIRPLAAQGPDYDDMTAMVVRYLG
jgi:sigma-B regulation protein RsbU (phosphoserine phosphatase)